MPVGGCLDPQSYWSFTQKNQNKNGGIMSAEAALKFAAEQGIEFVDVRFTDLLGQWHHLTIPIEEFGQDAFDNGVGFDASSLRGWAAINESDMLLVPDASRYWVDPFLQRKTLCIIADVVDPVSREGYA